VEIAIRHSPSFAVARCALDGGERVRAESGAMMAHSPGVQVEGKMEGGLMKSLKRGVLGGESLFITTFTAPAGGGWVDVAANLPGDMVEREVTPDRPINISRGSYLASEAGVDIDTKWGGFRNLVGGEGGFLIRASGAGTVLVACYGALEGVSLAPGESVVVDAGHMVAYDEGVQVVVRRVGSTKHSITSGEGLVFEFTGPGEVWTQTRNPSWLLQWIAGSIGSRS
jgi:uncharacterized protein (TIGR00266 family)